MLKKQTAAVQANYRWASPYRSLHFKTLRGNPAYKDPMRGPSLMTSKTSTLTSDIDGCVHGWIPALPMLAGPALAAFGIPGALQRAIVGQGLASRRRHNPIRQVRRTIRRRRALRGANAERGADLAELRLVDAARRHVATTTWRWGRGRCG